MPIPERKLLKSKMISSIVERVSLGGISCTGRGDFPPDLLSCVFVLIHYDIKDFDRSLRQ